MDLIIELNLYEYFKDNDYINLLSTNKEYYKLLNDNIYKHILYNI